MTEAIGAEKGERTAERVGYRSGYYERKLVTRVGVLELRFPQDRVGRFSLFECYQRSEKELVSALVEMYVQGVSTRKVKAITEELCGHSFSASTVSEATARLDEALKALFEQRLAEPYPCSGGSHSSNHPKLSLWTIPDSCFVRNARCRHEVSSCVNCTCTGLSWG
ncbi:MAG: hypothetical protein EOQ42_10370 [Mesorhizobium sp.]|nr:hypothetical protein EJ066_12845 [Mesorhizobium sp. M9A.F.Ca.ET.002.03.1.2]RWA75903.1 MAG: hypothetical protein EOQ28_06590 [Mesorhizobium sp.]TGQ36911.1 hypothetical protein EN859_021165 [Mesorhizobium sp. M00.F.Ca.ET.216.01.1.1]RWB76270.1 MAG: hypothetical protein EOQ42_10370 [Mesorhizobium sp.]RWJ43596.1 MAG: hypothetical protein EOR29_17270 [Mesorhizobium sp.]